MAKNSLKEAPYIKVYSYVDEEGNSLDKPRLNYESLATYVYAGNDKLEWRPNDPFEATLEIVTASRGRSSAVYIYRDIATDVQYTLFLSSVEHILRHATIKGGRVRGVWHVVKRGQNYGLDMLEAL